MNFSDPESSRNISENTVVISIQTSTEVQVQIQAGLLGDAEKDIFILVNHVVLGTAVCLLGVVANIINICVFLKQGLNNSMNISFFAVAISDMCGLVTLLWLNVCLNPDIDRVDSPFVFIEVQYLTAGWPTACFARITCWLTLYITAERCLSIALPLKVKQIVTPRRTAAVLIFIFIFNILILVPEYSTVYFDWHFYSTKNKSVVGLAFRSNRPQTEGLIFLLHWIFALVSFLGVVLFTAILIFKLKKTAKWRKKSTSNLEQNESMTTRDKKASAMIVLVASVLIFLYTPTVVCSIVSSFVADFGIVGRQANIFHAAFSFAFLMHTTNASVNIFFYYTMSTKYRNVFNDFFSLHRNGNSRSISELAPQGSNAPVGNEKRSLQKSSPSVIEIHSHLHS